MRLIQRLTRDAVRGVLAHRSVRRTERELSKLASVRYNGFRVFNLADASTATREAEAPRQSATVIAALQLVCASLPSHYRWLQNVTTIVLSSELPATVAFMPALPALIVDSGTAARYPSQTIAAYLVHEAVRVRYWVSGVRDARLVSQRVATRCADDLLQFVSTLPSAAYLIEWAVGLRERTLQASVLEAHQRVFDQERVGLLRLAGFPEFFIRWVERLRP